VGNALRDTTLLTLRTDKDSAVTTAQIVTPQLLVTKQRRRDGGSSSFKSTMSSLHSRSKLAGTDVVPNKNNHPSHHHQHHHDLQDKILLQTSIMDDDDHHPSPFQCVSRNGVYENHFHTNNNDVREPPSYAAIPIATTTTKNLESSTIEEILDMFDSDTTSHGQLLDLEPRPLKMSQWHSW
jgi:hypothetical protein